MTTGGGPADPKPGDVVGKPDDGKTTTDEPVDFDQPKRWITAAAGVRATATWTATALAAIGGVVFGAGPLITHTDLDPTKWSVLHIFLCLLGALVGASGIFILIAGLLSAQLPIELSMSTLPKNVVDSLNERHENLMPGNSQTVRQFLVRLRMYKVAVADLDAQLADATLPAEKRAVLERAKAKVEFNLAQYQKARAEMLAESEYDVAISRMSGSWPWQMAAGLIAAVLGATVYLLTISGKAPDSAKDAAAAAKPPRVGTLHFQTDDLLWKTLRLARCAVGNGAADIPVEVDQDDGKGSEDSPWSVRTLGYPEGCPDLSFTVTAKDATLTYVGTPTVTVTATPSPSPTG